jgi:hypothetical protein
VLLKVFRVSRTIGVLALGIAIGASGTAAAAGAAFLLGRANAETATSSLTNTGRGVALRVTASHGSPLQLAAPHGQPPFTVNSSREVVGLNAALLGGKSASSFSTTGAKAWAYWNGTALVSSMTFGVASVTKLGTGEYCFDLASGIPGASPVMVTPESQGIPGGDLQAYDAIELSGCRNTNQIAVLTVKSGSFADGVAFELAVF